jgi:hypothetical protein
MTNCIDTGHAWDIIASGEGSEKDESLRCQEVLECLACGLIEIQFVNPSTDQIEYRYYEMQP